MKIVFYCLFKNAADTLNVRLTNYFILFIRLLRYFVRELFHSYINQNFNLTNVFFNWLCY